MKPKIALIGDPSNIHFYRRMKMIDLEKFDLTIISPIFYDQSQYENIKIFSVDMKKFLRLRYIQWFYSYFNYIRKQDFDIIYCLGANMPLAWIAGVACRNDIIVTTVGVDVFMEDQVTMTYWTKKNIIQFFSRADKITVLSEFMKKCLVEKLAIDAKKISDDFLDIEQNWYEDNAQKTQIYKSSAIILSPRILSPLYQQTKIITAIAQVKKKYSDVLLLQTTYIRDENYLSECQKLVIDLGLEKNVIFLDELRDQKGLCQFYDLSDIIVMIPKSDGMPSSMIEAWARGKPVITSNIENYKRDWHLNYIFKSNTDTESLADSIRRLVEDKELSNRLVKNAKLFIQERRKLARDFLSFESIVGVRNKLCYINFKSFFYFLFFLAEPLVENLLAKWGYKRV